MTATQIRDLVESCNCRLSPMSDVQVEAITAAIHAATASERGLKERFKHYLADAYTREYGEPLSAAKARVEKMEQAFLADEPRPTG